jgi:hypothetical protein
MLLAILHKCSFSWLFLFASIGLIYSNTAITAQTADFILLKSPRALTIFNQYEQPLTADEKAQLSIGAPMQIMKADVRLGDQITRAMQCSFEQKTYFLLKNENNELPGALGNVQILKNCAILDDTVEIIGDAARFSSEFPSRVFSVPLKKGAVVILIFRFNNVYALKTTGPGALYGWSPISTQGAWRKKASAQISVDTALSSSIREELLGRIEAANESYKKFFEAFNHKTNSQKIIPEWKKLTTGSELRWRLNAPYDHIDELSESTKILVEQLRDILIGKPFTAIYEDGELTISPR